MAWLENRLLQLESKLENLYRKLQDLAIQIKAAQQTARAAFMQIPPEGGGGGLTADLWCRLGASLGPATGTWPSITATSTTADVYKGDGSGLTLVSEDATIRNRRNVTWVASRTTNLVPAADGDGFVIIDQDC